MWTEGEASESRNRCVVGGDTVHHPGVITCRLGGAPRWQVDMPRDADNDELETLFCTIVEDVRSEFPIKLPRNSHRVLKQTQLLHYLLLDRKDQRKFHDAVQSALETVAWQKRTGGRSNTARIPD